MSSEEGAKPKLKVGGELRFAFDTDDVSLHVAHSARADALNLPTLQRPAKKRLASSL